MEAILAVRNGYAVTAHALAAAVGGLPAAAAAAAALDAAGGALAGLLGRRTRARAAALARAAEAAAGWAGGRALPPAVPAWGALGLPAAVAGGARPPPGGGGGNGFGGGNGGGGNGGAAAGGGPGAGTWGSWLANAAHPATRPPTIFLKAVTLQVGDAGARLRLGCVSSSVFLRIDFSRMFGMK
jgi:hypothetical protein